MSPSISDEEVINMMRLAKNNLKNFASEKPKGRKLSKTNKLREAIDKIKQVIPNVTFEEQKILLDKLMEVKNQLEIEEASSPAQQAAIAINMKKTGKKPKKKVSETADYLPEK
jgi:hypothetical protein